MSRRLTMIQTDLGPGSDQIEQRKQHKIERMGTFILSSTNQTGECRPQAVAKVHDKA